MQEEKISFSFGNGVIVFMRNSYRYREKPAVCIMKSYLGSVQGTIARWNRFAKCNTVGFVRTIDTGTRVAH